MTVDRELGAGRDRPLDGPTGSTPPTDADPLALRCVDLEVGYGSAPVLRGLDLEVHRDEVVATLGPSGCGKTTLLSAVAGFVTPTEGSIEIGGRTVATGRRAEPPEHRGIGIVFQHYALWPHLAAVDIVAYPMRRAGMDRVTARARAEELLGRLGVDHLALRRPAELSGGEQQRVGLARALAGRPNLYLFDEPTAHLDSALRAVFRDEVAARRRETGAAAVYATHDAPEALAVADRVALLRDGAVAQIGDPTEVYGQPIDLWAALLTGPASVLACRGAPNGDGTVRLAIGGAEIVVNGGGAHAGSPEVRALVRPDWTHLDGPLRGRVSAVRYEGPHTDYTVKTDAGAVVVREARPPRRPVGAELTWGIERAWLLPDEPAPLAGVS